MWAKILLVSILVLLVGGVIGGLTWIIIQQEKPTPQTVFQTALADNLNLQTFQESLSVNGGLPIATRTRTFDLSSSTAKVLITNEAIDPNGDLMSMIVIGGNFYTKTSYTHATLAAASGATLAALQSVNNQWVLRVQNGQIINDSLTTQLGGIDAFSTSHYLVPMPIIAGLFSASDQQTLAGYTKSGSVYSVPSSAPVTEQVNNQAAWDYTVTVNKQALQQLETQAGRMLQLPNSAERAAEFIQTMPTTMHVWVSKKTGHIIQYSYLVGVAVDTVSYSNENMPVTIIASGQVANAHATPAAAPTTTAGSQSDTQIIQAITQLSSSLHATVQAAAPVPLSQSTLQSFVQSKDPQILSAGFTVNDSAGYPEIGEIFYQPDAECNPVAPGFYASNSDESFALVTRTSAGLYCIDSNGG
jgi:uncharacterized protein (DUF427 family)